MKVRCFILVSSLVVSLFGSRAQADFFVDEFITPQVLPDTGGFISGPGILGLERDAQAYSPTINFNTAVPGQLWAYNAHPVNWGTVFLTYDGVDNNLNGSFLNGLGNVDFTQGGLNDRFRLVVSDPLSLGGVLVLTAMNVGGAGSTFSMPLPATEGIVEVPFASFVTGGFGASHPVNWADVGFFEMELQLFPGESYRFDGIAVVPEPGVGALAGIGLLTLGAFGARRWRQRRRR